MKLHFLPRIPDLRQAIAGVRTAAVFTTEVDGGEAEILLLPPNRAERRSLASHTGSPNLDEHCYASVLMFSDDTYARLTEQIRQNPFNRNSPEMGRSWWRPGHPCTQRRRQLPDAAGFGFALGRPAAARFFRLLDEREKAG